jgi:hypothetical protein
MAGCLHPDLARAVKLKLDSYSGTPPKILQEKEMRTALAQLRLTGLPVGTSISLRISARKERFFEPNAKNA